MIVIGLDGAHKEMFESEYAPEFLKELYSEGADATLNSVDPALTLPAWPCMCSGKNPESLGIFGLTNVEMTQEGLELKEFDLSKIDFLWNHMSDLESSILNVPGTYPITSLNGRMVTGMRTPSKKKTFAYPEEFQQEIEKDLPNYIIEPPPPNAVSEKKYYKYLKTAAESRLELLEKELSKDPDFLFAVFRVTDIMQHVYWEDEEKKSEILSIVSEGLEKLIDTKDEDVFIISDHGFNKYKRGFDIKKWLKEEEYLFQDNEHQNSFLTDYGISRENVLKLFTTLKIDSLVDKIPKSLRRKIPRDDKITEEDIIYNDMLDYERTKAFFVNGGIYINPRFEVDDVKEEIYQKLKDLEDPKTGIKPVKPKKIESEGGPEIMVEFHEKYTGSNDEDKVFGDVDTSGHGKKGIFIASGPSMKESQNLDSMNIPDITPTILHYYGKKVLESMDGGVQKQVFKKGSGPAERDVEYSEDVTEGLDI